MNLLIWKVIIDRKATTTTEQNYLLIFKVHLSLYIEEIFRRPRAVLSTLKCTLDIKRTVLYLVAK